MSNFKEMEFDGHRNVIVDAIDNLIKDNEYISEVQTNGPGLLFYKERGRPKRIKLNLNTEAEYSEAIDGLITKAGLIKKDYIVEGRYTLSDGRFGRLHIIMPPATPYPLVTLALKTDTLTNLTAIQGSGSFNTEISMFLKAMVESKATAILSGGTGAGKALHKDVEIPTPFGLKTVKDINVGDIIFDEKGNETKVLNKYCPKDPKSYKVEFKSGKKVKTSAGHLWNATMLNEKEKIGKFVGVIASEDEVQKLEDELTKTKKTDYIPKREIKKIIKNNSSVFAKMKENLTSKVGRELIVLNENELNLMSEKIKLLKNLDSTRPKTLSEVIAHTDKRINHDVMRDIVSTKKYVSNEVYYNKHEALSMIIKDFRERLDFSKRKKSHLKKKDIRPRKVISTEDMYEYGVRKYNGRLNFAIDSLSEPVKYSKKNLLIDPYTLGVWLGDGVSDRAVVSGADTEIHHKILESYELEKETSEQRKEHYKVLYAWRYKNLVDDLRAYNLLNNKHIPIDYKLSSAKQRKDLLAGLIDTDGSVDKRGVLSFGNTRKGIVEGAREIAASLGWRPTKITSKIGSYKDEEGNTIECKEIYSFTFKCTDIDLQVKRKRDALDKPDEQKTQQVRHSRHYIVNITEIQDNPDDYYCFQVDSPNKLFLCTDEFIPTHNTTLLEALTTQFHDDERVGVAEDSPELELHGPNTAYMNSTVWSPGMDANEVADLTWVVQQLNRMRIDRIIIGETRGKEFFDFVVAANSGKPGSLTTIHANDGPAAMKKMATFMYMAVDMSPRIINEMISEAVDIVIQLGHNEKTGEHKIISIHEVTDAISSGDSPAIALNPLFSYDHESDTWTKRYATDKFKKKLESSGFDPNNYSIASNDDEYEDFGGGLPSYFNKG